MTDRIPLPQEPTHPAGYARVEPEFFATLGIPLVRGRLFRENETGVAIVNQTMAARYWPDKDPIGQTIWIGEREPLRLEVVGVARDAKYYALSEEALPFVYWNIADARFQSFRARMFVKTAADPRPILNQVREAFAKVDPRVEIRDVVPLATLVEFATWPTRLAVELLGGFSLLGLMLGAEVFTA